MQLPVHLLLFPPPVTAGFNGKVMADLLSFYRATNDDTVPILVTVDGPHYRITDGRHRAFASMWAGRKTIAAVIQPSAVPYSDPQTTPSPDMGNTDPDMGGTDGRLHTAEARGAASPS